MGIITSDGLTKKYGELLAVNDVSFDINEGECFGFLGPNGAGKTTVMSIIYCFMPPTSGLVKVFNMDVTKEPGTIKSRTGVMPQDDNLDPDLSVLENLIVYARYFDIMKKDSLALSNRLLEFVDLSEKADVNIKDLSGGMKRRLLLARSLLNDPDLLILDEPTTGLDPHSRRDVWAKLNHLKFNNTTLLLTTHYMEEAQRLCDRVAIMDLGKLITIDSPANLMDIHGGNLEDVYIKLTGKKLSGDTV
ncbi:MAG: ABC transporter ATP-binding protein [Nitrospirota bacterium]|nr:MAG: ABC transporter ATP-binding protein [Nitrospirota bacterium]